MLEELKEEEIVNKVGGRFKLSTLIQKRLAYLVPEEGKILQNLKLRAVLH